MQLSTSIEKEWEIEVVTHYFSVLSFKCSQLILQGDGLAAF